MFTIEIFFGSYQLFLFDQLLNSAADVLCACKFLLPDDGQSGKKTDRNFNRDVKWKLNAFEMRRKEGYAGKGGKNLTP